jgi:photosystem II stability/assembly factor-like uncharacterized protein
MKRIITSLIFVIVTISTNAQWIEYNPLPWFNELSSVKFISPAVGWIVSWDGSIMRTNDGGTHWIIQPIIGPVHGYYSLWGVSFTDVNNGTAVGNGEIIRTTNGGTVWFQQSLDSTIGTPFLDAVSFTDVNNGTAVGYKDTLGNNADVIIGTILRTTNGGNTWVSQTSGINYQLRGLPFPILLEEQRLVIWVQLSEPRMEAQHGNLNQAEPESN